MPALTDSTCHVHFDVGLPDLSVAAVRGVDRISELFRFEIDVVIGNPDEADSLDLEGLIGKPCHLKFTSEFLEAQLGDDHIFHGFVTRIQQGDHDEHFTNFRITMMPRVAKLTHRSSCRIFQEADAQAIVEKILGEHGFAKGTDFDFRLSEALIERPYCVQYRETDWDFVTRILQEDGVFCFFIHDATKETLVFGSENPVHPNLVGGAAIPFHRREAGAALQETISAITVGESLLTGAVRLREWNFQQPDLTGDAHFEVDVTSAKSPAALEVYDYPGQYAVASPDGKGRAKIRLEQLQTGKRVAHGESTSPRMTAGHVFEMTGHYRDDFNVKYVVLEVHHRVSTAIGDIGLENAAQSYSSEFVAQPREVPFRPAPRGPKPRIPSVQTALVVGPAGEEIHTDERGRVLLKFHWDRAPDREAPTAWVRVAQIWGSSEWGAFFLPRIEQEVVVAFEDGDPDRPLVVGTVYYHTPPLALPANKTQSTIKSRSTPKGDGYNELRFEDKKDAEEIHIHAQKDLDMVILNNTTHNTGNDESWTIGHDRTTDVGNDDKLTVGKDQTIEIKGNFKETISGTSTVEVTKASAVTLDATSSLEITKASTVKIGGTSSVEITNNSELKVSAAAKATIAKALAVKAKTIAIEAEDELTITVGKVSVVLKKNGDVTLTAGGKITVEAEKDLAIESKKSITLKGGKDIKAEASSNVVLKGSKIAGN